MKKKHNKGIKENKSKAVTEKSILTKIINYHKKWNKEIN